MIRLKFCTIEPYQNGCRVRFDAGVYCVSTPHFTPHYHVIAHRCGYGDDVSAYCVEHEFAHVFMEEKLHSRPSRVLHGLATGKPISDNEAVYEEVIAQTFQRWLRANERPILGGVDWDTLKVEALQLLEGLPV